MPNDLVVVGIPVSAQSDNNTRRDAWKERVAEAAREAIPEEDRVEFGEVTLPIVHFSFDWQGDLDNIAKPIIDGLSGPAFFDDIHFLTTFK